MNNKLPPLPPKKPKEPLMRFARPAMREMINRLEILYKETSDHKISEFIKEAKSWPQNASGLPKEQVKRIKQRAGELLFRFNSEYAGNDRIKY